MGSIVGKLKSLLFVPEIQREGVDLQAYLKKVDSGKWKDRLVFGISKRHGGFMVIDPKDVPGGGFIGGMGSGKSVAMRFTMVTDLVCNSENVIQIAIDPFKSMVDYQKLWKYPNVIPCLGQEEKFITVMDLLWAECERRNKEFRKVGAKHIYDYDKITGEQIARIRVYCEEFHSISGSKTLDFHNKIDKEGTAAWQLKNLMRVGRSFGITFYLATQRASYDDVPSAIKPGIMTWCAFKVGNPGDAQAANLPQAADIPGGMQGRCATETGWVQFPYIEENIHPLIDSRIKPFKGKLLAFTLEDLRKATEADGNSGMLWVKPVSFAVSNFSQFDIKEVAKRIFSIFDFKVEPQPNPSLVADLIAEKDGEKYAVVLHKSEGGRFSRGDEDKKSPEALAESLPILKISKVISMSFGGDDPMKNLVEETGGYSIGSEELKRIGEVVDGKSSFADMSEYESLFSKLVLARPPIPSPTTEEIEPEEEKLANDVEDELEDPEIAFLKKKFQGRSKIIVED